MKIKMTVAAILATGILFAAEMGLAAITMDTVEVGDVGNGNDPTTGYGSVGYSYAIGKYEVTVGQYTAFLNAVAATDTYSLYNANMGTDLNVAGISQSGTSGSYTYSVMTNSGQDMTNRPITYVSWFDAARFANWMANGQPVGAQGNATTEDGTYTLNGAMSGLNFTRNVVNPTNGSGTIFWLPSEDEWYKAAYYSPGASGDSYWLYPTQSDSAPGNVIGSALNQANINLSGYSTGSAPYITDGGAYGGSASHYGAFDQGGNVWEWNDAVSSGLFRGIRGGAWSFGSVLLNSSFGNGSTPESENNTVGFRLASVPEPSAALLVLIAGVGWLFWKRGGRRPHP